MSHRLRDLVSRFADVFLTARSAIPVGRRQERTLLLVRLNGIGDYVLFRDFLPAIRAGGPYGGWRVTLCGNAAWRELAEQFDGPCVDEFVWVHRRRLAEEVAYKWRLMSQLRARGFAAAVNTAVTRDYYSDLLTCGSGAPVRIGVKLPAASGSARLRQAIDRLYTRLVEVPEGVHFEFHRNKAVMEAVLGMPLDPVRPSLDTSAVDCAVPSGGYAVLFPDVSESSRRWPAAAFAEVADWLASRGLTVAVDAGPELLAEIRSAMRRSEALITGKGRVSLPQLAKLVAQAEILISTDSCAIHIAAACGTRFVCVSNGGHFGRYVASPKDYFTHAAYVYPFPSPTTDAEFERMVRELRGYAGDIAAIPPARVIAEAERLLGG